MKNGETLFDLFGGVRTMAYSLREAVGTVGGWKKNARIPSQKQPHVLETGIALGLPITAENVVYPLGRPVVVAPYLNNPAIAVACDRQDISQSDAAA